MKISCIVPVYNEGSRVGAVLDVLVGHEFIDEVIVVNDGSSDNSEEVLKNIKGIKLISYQKNRGKSHAIRIGLEKARNEWVMTIDSDLQGLNRKNIVALVLPIVSHKADLVMTLRKNSLGIFKFFKLDFVSGERVFRKNMIRNLSDLEKLPGFGLEVFLNQIIIEKRMKLVVVNWPNVVTPRKSVKFGFLAGVKGDFKMILQIKSVIGWSGILKQFWEMYRLRIY
jgi:glycosyltransferase involved in cell wall biosynthesis